MEKLKGLNQNNFMYAPSALAPNIYNGIHQNNSGFLKKKFGGHESFLWSH